MEEKNIYDEILEYQKKYNMTYDALHASLWVLNHKFKKKSIIFDLTVKPYSRPPKIEKYKKALDDLKAEKMENTDSLRRTLKYFEKRYYAFDLDEVFQSEGVFTYRTITKALESEYIPECLYNKILSYLLTFEDSLML